MSRDAKDSRDPREIYGMLEDGKRGIPKRALAGALKRRNKSQTDLVLALGISKQRTRVSDWISGKRRMENADVIAASFALEVSPLYILGLTPHPDIDTTESFKQEWAAKAAEDREYLLARLQNGATMAEALADAELNGIYVNPGADYRDLATLAKDYVDAFRSDRLLYAIELLAHDVSGHSAQVQGYPSLHKVRR